MGNRSGELEEFLDDAEDFEGNDAQEVDPDARKRLKKPPTKGPKTTAWRDIEDHNEAKRLKQALSEFYDDDADR